MVPLIYLKYISFCTLRMHSITNDIYSELTIQYKSCDVITWYRGSYLTISYISVEQHIAASHLTRINPKGKYREQKSKDSSLHLIIVYIAEGHFMHKIFYLRILHQFCFLHQYTYISNIKSELLSQRATSTILPSLLHWYARHYNDGSLHTEP